MRIRHRSVLIALLVAVVLWAPVACGGSGGEGDAVGEEAENDTPTTLRSEEPIQIVFNAELSGSLVYDTALVKKGVRTALQMLGNQVAGWPIEYREVDNGSDPLTAIEETRALVEMDSNGDGKVDDLDREPVDFICGPLSSDSVAGVTFFLAQNDRERERIPQCSVTGQPRENIVTAAGLGFIPNGIFSSHGYYLGKFAVEELGYKTVNCVHYADRIAEDLQSGFEQGFALGEDTNIQSVTYVPAGTADFASVLATLEPADCTLFWIRGAGAIQFVRQHAASGLGGGLLVPMASNYSESQLEYLNALGIGTGIVACDVYTPLLENPMNTEFIEAFQGLYPGERPSPEAFGGWQAVMLYAKGVEEVARLADDGEDVDPRDPADVIEAMSELTMDTPAGPITMGQRSKTYVATRNFYIMRSRDVGGGRIAWAPLYTYTQVRLGG